MRNKKIFKITMVLAVALLSFLVGWFGRQQYINTKYDSAGDLANSYIIDVLSGNTESAYSKILPSVKTELKEDSLKTSTKPFVSPQAKIVAQTTTQIQDRYVTYVTVEGLSDEGSKLSDGYFVVTTSKEEGKLGVESSAAQ